MKFFVTLTPTMIAIRTENQRGTEETTDDVKQTAKGTIADRFSDHHIPKKRGMIFQSFVNPTQAGRVRNHSQVGMFGRSNRRKYTATRGAMRAAQEGRC